VIPTASWLNINVPNSILDPYNQYTVLRCDRGLSRIGVAFCVLVSKKLHVISVDLSELYPELEIHCFDLIYFNVKCQLFAVYKAPKSGSIGRSLQCLNQLSKVKYHCIIAGDFNCTDWQALTAPVDGIHDVLVNFSMTKLARHIDQESHC